MHALPQKTLAVPTVSKCTVIFFYFFRFCGDQASTLAPKYSLDISTTAVILIETVKGATRGWSGLQPTAAGAAADTAAAL